MYELDSQRPSAFDPTSTVPQLFSSDSACFTDSSRVAGASPHSGHHASICHAMQVFQITCLEAYYYADLSQANWKEPSQRGVDTAQGFALAFLPDWERKLCVMIGGVD